MRRLRRPTGGLWSNADFLKLWTGQSISEFGSQVSQLAIPWLAAVGLHASAVRVLAPRRARLPAVHPLRAARRRLGRPAAPPADPHRRRRLARRAARADPDPLGARTRSRCGSCSSSQFVIGIFTVFFDVAYQSYLPSLVEREQLDRRQLEAAADRLGRAGRRPEHLRRADRRDHRAVRDRRSTRRASSSRRSSCSAIRHRENAAGARRRRAAAEDVAGGEGRPALGRRPPAGCARSRRARAPRTSSSRCSSRSRCSTSRARCTCRAWETGSCSPSAPSARSSARSS